MDSILGIKNGFNSWNKKWIQFLENKTELNSWKTKLDLKLDSKLDSKMESKLDSKLHLKLDSKLDSKLDLKLDSKNGN